MTGDLVRLAAGAITSHRLRSGLSMVGQVAILVHTGSRGLGHQICTDYVARMDRSMVDYDFSLPDRQLACAPLASDEGRAYLGAMAAAAAAGGSPARLSAECTMEWVTVRRAGGGKKP